MMSLDEEPCLVRVVGENVNLIRGESEDEVVEKKEDKITCYLFLLTTFTALGGFLFGYDTGVISGAMIPLKKQFQLSKLLQESIVSVALVGAILGSLGSGVLNNRLGRRPSVILGGFLFTAGSLVMGLANGSTVLLLGRFLVGLGIGLVSMVVPVYIAEAAPSRMRGQLVTTNVAFITFGQFFASVLNGVFTSTISQQGWRLMLGAAALPSFILMVGFYWMPESPRWLISKGKYGQARKILMKLRGSDNIGEEFGRMRKALLPEKSQNGGILRILRTDATRRALIVGCSLQAFQQLSGINTVMYYSASIIQLAGVQDEKQIIWLSAAVASGNFIFTMVSMLLIERVGRRKLTLLSILGVSVALALLAGMFWRLDHSHTPANYRPVPSNCSHFDTCQSCLAHAQCGFCYAQSSNNISHGACLFSEKFCSSKTYNNTIPHWSASVCPTQSPWLPVVAMVIYLAVFAVGMGSMPWCVNSEIYPLWARSEATSIATATNWCLNLLVSLTFLNLLDWLTKAGAFILYSSIAFAGFVFLYLFLPETRNSKLEEIEQLFQGSVFVPCKRRP